MDIKTRLTAALDSLVSEYERACAEPKPSYSIDGQSVTWGDYLRMLSESIQTTSELLGVFDPVELRSQMT